MKRNNLRLPKSLNSILWSYDLKNLSLERDKEIIITQVLNYGLWDDIKWLLKTYGEDEIKEVVANPGRGRWWKKVLNFWVKILDIEIKKEVFENAIIKNKHDFK